MAKKIKKMNNKLESTNHSKKHMSKKDDPPKLALEVEESVDLSTRVSMIVMMISAVIAGFGLAALLVLPTQKTKVTPRVKVTAQKPAAAERVTNGQFMSNQILVKFKPSATEQAKDSAIQNVLKLPVKANVDSTTGKVIQSYNKYLPTDKSVSMPKSKSQEIKTSLKKREKLIEKIGAKAGLDKWELVLFTQETDINQLVSRFKKETSVEYAEPNYVVEATMAPNDKFYTEQFGVCKNTVGGYYDGDRCYQDSNCPGGSCDMGTNTISAQWGLSKVDAERAWDTISSTPLDSMTVAVLDSGVDYYQSEIEANIWINKVEDLNNNGVVEQSDFDGIDNDGNGYIDDIRGWDFTTCKQISNGSCQVTKPESNDPMDDSPGGHGTHVAGIVSAITSNSNGIASLGGGWASAGKSGVKIMALKVLYQDTGLVSDVARAITYASNNGTKVLNMSLSFYGYSQMLADAAVNAQSQGSLLVAAAGNDKSSALFYSPANLPGVLTVAATDKDDVRWQTRSPVGSNNGPNIGVSAPGKDILSLKASNVLVTHKNVVDGNYFLSTGTSQATPQVAALAALIWAKRPGFTNEQVASAIKMGADDLTHQPENCGIYMNQTDCESKIHPTCWWNPSLTPASCKTWDVSYGAGWDPYTGAGRINAYKTLNISNPMVAKITSPPNTENYTLGDTITIKGSASGAIFLNYKVEYINEDLKGQWTQISTASTPVTDGTLANWNTTGLSGGSYYLRLTVSGVTTSMSYSLSDAKLVNISHPFQAGNWSGKQVSGYFISSPVFADLDPTHSGLEVLFASQSKAYAWYQDGTDMSGWPVDTIGTGMGISVADLNNDGQNEVIETTTNNIYIWNTNGQPVASWQWPRGHSWLASPPAIGDLDGDRDLEIVYTSYIVHPSYSDVAIYAYHHDGTAVSGWPVIVTKQLTLSTPVLADLDNDGDKEIIVGLNKLYAYHHDDKDLDGKPDLMWSRDLGGSMQISSPAVADIDGDVNGDLEIVVGSNYNKVYAYHHDGTALAGWPVVTNDVLYSSPALGDINNDGKLEIIVGSNDNFVYAWKYDGTSVTGWPIETNGKVTSSPVIADLDGDGDLEIAVGSEDGKFYVWHHDGTSVQGFPVTTTAAISSSPAVANLDQDSHLEIGVVNDAGKIYLWELPWSATNNKLVWPVFHHDQRHTGLYNQCSDYTQWGQCNPITKQYCNNGMLENCPVTKPYCNPTNFACEAKCSDGTPFGQCNAAKKYCDNGNLVNNCSRCGCPSDKPYCNTSSLLCEAKCTDGTAFGQCNASKQYCDNGNLKYWCNRCTYTCPTNKPFCMTNGDCVVCRQSSDCPDSLACTNDICNSPGTASSYCSHPSNCLSTQPYCNQTSGICEAKCSDGTLFGQCNASKLYCDNGNLVTNCQKCGGCSTPSCFLSGTPILLADGSVKPIENIKVGDLVMAFDEDTNEYKQDKVKETYKHKTDNYLIINGHLKITKNHPVYSNGQWIEIGKLKIKDKLFNFKAEPETITSIKEINQEVTVYNLEVSHYQTYIAGGVVVHNKKAPTPPSLK